MPLRLNGVEIDDLRVNGVQAETAYLNGTSIYQRMGVGSIVNGKIVAGQRQGRWILIAFAADRYVASWPGEVTSSPTRNALQIIYQNRHLIDAADPTNDGSTTVPTIANIGALTAEFEGQTQTWLAWTRNPYSGSSAEVVSMSTGEAGHTQRVQKCWVIERELVTL